MECKQIKNKNNQRNKRGHSSWTNDVDIQESRVVVWQQVSGRLVFLMKNDKRGVEVSIAGPIDGGKL